MLDQEDAEEGTRILSLGPMVDPMIIDVDDLALDVPRWSAALARILGDPERAGRYARDVRSRLAPRRTWRRTVDTLLRELA
jgi:hypothetical protein